MENFIYQKFNTFIVIKLLIIFLIFHFHSDHFRKYYTVKFTKSEYNQIELFLIIYVGRHYSICR